MKIRFLLFLLLTAQCFHVFADVVYFNVNPDAVILPQDAEYFIDMNNDGINDFSITNNVNAGANIFDIIFSNLATGCDVVSTDAGGGIFNVTVLTNGTNVGAGSSFSGQAAPSQAFLRSETYTSWSGQTNRFVGVTFTVGTNTYYGWIRISISATSVVTVVDWAYNNTNNATIAAGDVGSGGLILVANFTASSFAIDAGECIDFQDLSTGNPTFWEWTFDGAQTPGSNDQNPSGICYYTPGVYNVTLNVQNATNTDTYTCIDCITVIDQTTIPIANFVADEVVIPAGGVVNFTNLSINGPFDEFAWSFEGGLPFSSSDENPENIAYANPGIYDVQLVVTDANGNQDTELKQDYIKVIPLASEPPVVNFIANYTVIAPGESVNFRDLTYGHPYRWNWTFQGASVATSTEQHPQNIVYNNPGVYTVQLVAWNNLGIDSLMRTDYIVVSNNPPCTSPPVPDFRASNRLIVASNKVYFEDLTTNNPSNWNWYFEYGYPSYSNNSNITQGIEYNFPGIYDVTLTVNNNCGSDYITKNDYIYVFTGPVSFYCDTLRNLAPNELVTTVPVSGWGEIAGHNSQRVRTYADYFEDHSFTQIEALIVPVRTSTYGSISSYVNFYIWDGSTPYPDSVLAMKKVLIKDIPANFYSVITFNPPVEVNGPFFAGFGINYPDSNQDGISDDRFVVSVAQPRGNQVVYNSLYMQILGQWYSCLQRFGFSTSTDIRPVACLVNIEEVMTEMKIKLYPNPASDIVNLDMGELSFQRALVSIFDMTGRKLTEIEPETDGLLTLDISSYKNGLYFVQINFDGKRVTKKLSIQR